MIHVHSRMAAKVLMLFVFVLGATVVQAALLNVVNPGFDQPASGKISYGFDPSGANLVDVPGWLDSGTIYNDTGVEISSIGNPPGVHSPGNVFAAYAKSGDSGAYQITTNQIVSGTTYVLSFWTRRSSTAAGTSTNQVILFKAAATNTTYSGVTVLAVTNVANTNNTTWNQSSLSYTAGSGDAGSYLGISFQNTTPLLENTNWGEWDQFNLMVGLSITTQPQSVDALSGDPVSFSVAAANNNGTITYQWKRGPVGGPYTNVVDGGTISGATSNLLSISSLNTGSDLGGYEVVVSDSVTNETSKVAVLTATNSLAIVNPGFEQNWYEKFQYGFDNPTNDVPGWKNANVPSATNASVVLYTDSGVDVHPRTGSANGYTKSGEGGAYQILPYQIQSGDVLTLSWWAHANNNNNHGAQFVSLIGATNAAEPFANCTVLATLSNAVPQGAYQLYTLTYTNTLPANVGKHLGVYLNTASNGFTTWISFDDLALNHGTIVVTNLYFGTAAPLLRYGAPGISYQVQLLADYSDGTKSNDVTSVAQYSIADQFVATNTTTGGIGVVGLHTGSTTLIASYSGLSATQTVTLLAPTALRVAPFVPSYPPPYVSGPSLGTKVYADFGSAYTNVDVSGYDDPLSGPGTVAGEWASANSSVFTAGGNQSGGQITPQSPGTANLTVQFTPLTASMPVTVVPFSPFYQLLVNPSFEQPALGKINYGFDPSGTNVIDVPGWSDAYAYGTNYNPTNAYLDSGIEPKNAESGTYCAYCRAGDGGAYQMANYQMTNGDTLILTWWAQHTGGNTGATTQMVSMVSAPLTSTPYTNTVTLAADNSVLPGTGTSPAGYANYAVTYHVTAADAGKYVGVYFNNANPAENNFAAWDDFDLSVQPMTTAPAAPVGLTATPGVQQMTLNWPLTSGATSYFVKRGLSSGSETTIANVTGNSYTNVGLTAGTTYYYVVSATNSFGESLDSDEVSAVPFPPGPPPTPIITLSGSQLVLSWTNGVLQQATNVAGPWSDAVGVTSPYTNIVTGSPQMFFRTRQ